MTLREKLSTIDYPPVKSFTTGEASTISDFWETFVKPHLISADIISKWCDLLYRYVDDVGVVYAIRTFNDRRENGDKDLRRGFVTKTDKNYSFFYTDNYFSAYFLKMAIDGYVPEYSDFKEMMISRKFPARFGQSCSLERAKAAYKIDAKDPKISIAGYKISHIFDVGTGYYNNNTTLSISQICSKYFPRGTYDDWSSVTDKTGTYYSRSLKVDAPALAYLKAIFLRMSCPLNYILTPKKKLHTTEVKVEKNDIGESLQLQQYAMYQFSQLYGDIYKDFLNRIMLHSDYIFSSNAGKNFIGIKYNIHMDSESVPKPATIKSNSVTNTSANLSSSVVLTEKLKAECIKAYLFDGLSFRRIELDVMHIDSPVRGGGFKAQSLMRSYKISAELKGIFSNLTLSELHKTMTEKNIELPPAFELMFRELL